MTILQVALQARTDGDRAKTLIVLGQFVVFLFVVIFLGLFITGLVGEDEWLTIIGSTFLYITAAGTWLLYIKKKEKDFLKIGDNSITLTGDESIGFIERFSILVNLFA